MTSSPTDATVELATPELVTRFADAFNAQYLTGHTVGSPLGLWLLLALLSPVATGPARDELEAVLGTGVDDAARRAGDLLDEAHPAVGAAVAVWANELHLDGQTFTAWAAALPRTVERGPVPTQRIADEWANTATRGLIATFPVPLDPQTAVVLASALVTTVTWLAQFEDATPADLGGPFGAQVDTALQAPAAHRQFLARTDAAGLVGAHVADSADGLSVISVIADPAVPSADVHRAAGQVARLVAGANRTHARSLSLFDVPLGAGHAWEVTETLEDRFGGGMTDETVHAILPAWSASSTHDLTNAPGVPAAFATLETFLASQCRPGSYEARQVAVASYRRDGFDAAVLTAMMMRCSAAPIRVQARVREATIRFNRPYAVVAVTTGRVVSLARGWGYNDLGVPAWDGMPVFAAWVAQPGR